MSEAASQQIEAWLHRLTLARALPALALVVALIAWNRGVALLYGLVALLVATLAVAWLAPRMNLAGVSARRHHPPTANEGELLPLTMTISTTGRLARYMLELTDRVPGAEADPATPSVYFDRVRGTAQVTLPIHCALRGEHLLGPLRVATAYPLGLHRRERVLPDSESRLLVYPTPLPLRHLPLPASAANPEPGRDQASRAGDSDLFLGVRDYRHGDNPRHVHWAATARHGRLMTKEFEYPRGTRLLIVLDLDAAAQAGAGYDSTLEYAVKIAVSVAHFALAAHHQVGLLGLAAVPVRIPLGRGGHHYREILEVLARVQATGNAPYAQAINEARALLGVGGNLLLFEHGGQAGAPAVAGRGMAHALRVRFDMASFDGEGWNKARPPRRGTDRHDTYTVRRGDDLARLFER